MYVNQLTAEERSKVIKLTEKQCRQMMTIIYKKKMDYFKSGGDDWKEVSVVLLSDKTILFIFHCNFESRQ